MKDRGYSVAMLADVACGEYASVEEEAKKLVRVTETVSPTPEIAARYEDQYQRFHAIYPTVKSLFPKLNGCGEHHENPSRL